MRSNIRAKDLSADGMRLSAGQLLWSLAYCLFAIHAGSASAGVTDEILPGKVSLKAVYVDRDLQPINDATLPNTIPLRVSLIPGNISGVADSPALFEFPLKVGEEKSLNLASAQQAVERSAAPLTKQGADSGLTITPPDAKFARFSTVVAYLDTDKGVGGASFRGSRRNETLLMVYFERPCKVSGVTHSRTATVTYNVGIARSGVHLLSLVRDSASSAHVTEVVTLSGPLTLSIVPSR
jgi:hypothetical protein